MRPGVRAPHQVLGSIVANLVFHVICQGPLIVLALVATSVGCTSKVAVEPGEPARFEATTEFLLRHDLLLGREDLPSAIGVSGRPCPGAPKRYVSYRAPSVTVTGEATLDAYRAWHRALAQAWIDLLDPSNSAFDQRAEALYCSANREIWKGEPETQEELGEAGLVAFSTRQGGASFYELLVARAAKYQTPPSEVPDTIRAAYQSRSSRPPLPVRVLVAAPTGPARIFKYCQTRDGSAITLNVSSPELARCAELHFRLLSEDTAYAADFQKWVERATAEVARVVPRDAARFQKSLYTDLEANTSFFPQLLGACASTRAAE